MSELPTSFSGCSCVIVIGCDCMLYSLYIGICKIHKFLETNYRLVSEATVKLRSNHVSRSALSIKVFKAHFTQWHASSIHIFPSHIKMSQEEQPKPSPLIRQSSAANSPIIHEVNLSVPKDLLTGYLDYLREFTKAVCDDVDGECLGIWETELKRGGSYSKVRG